MYLEQHDYGYFKTFWDINFYGEFCLKVTWFTGKSLSEGLILVSTNPQYDNRLFIELRVQYMKITNSEHGENVLCA